MNIKLDRGWTDSTAFAKNMLRAVDRRIGYNLFSIDNFEILETRRGFSGSANLMVSFKILQLITVTFLTKNLLFEHCVGDKSQILALNGGLRGRQFNYVIQTCPRLTLVATVTKICLFYFNTKLGITRQTLSV